jgi:hypothetical protein
MSVRFDLQLWKQGKWTGGVAEVGRGADPAGVMGALLVLAKALLDNFHNSQAATNNKAHGCMGQVKQFAGSCDAHGGLLAVGQSIS